MERSVDRRLSGLERAIVPELTLGIVVIYDPATGQPLHLVRLAEVSFWIPTNGRDRDARSNSDSGDVAGTPGDQ